MDLVGGSGSRELSQLFFLPQRSAVLIDVAANTLGAGLGYVAARGARLLLKQYRERNAPPAAQEDAVS